jgi:hypothetical protein
MMWPRSRVERGPLLRQRDNHNFGSLLMLWRYHARMDIEFRMPPLSEYQMSNPLLTFLPVEWIQGNLFYREDLFRQGVALFP